MVSYPDLVLLGDLQLLVSVVALQEGGELVEVDIAGVSGESVNEVSSDINNSLASFLIIMS